MLSEKDKEFLYGIKDKIVKTHEKCKGEGYYSGKSGIVQCDCMKILSYIIGLRKSNIPMDYWSLELKKLKIDDEYKDIIQDYINKLDNAIEKGIGLFISSEIRGVGKTSLACEIAKSALIKRYDVYYNIMQTIISDTFSDQKTIIEKINNAELVIIDEVDKVAMRKESPLSVRIENFLREILPAGKTIIICSNMGLEEIDSKIKIGSLIQRYMKVVNVNGNDFSQTKNATLDSMLESSIDYFSKSILNNAKIYEENKYISYKKEAHRYMD